MGMLRPVRRIGRPFFGARAAVPKGPYESAAAHVSIASRSKSQVDLYQYLVCSMQAPCIKVCEL